jgi:peptidyl-prolyl cis-trans isomerase D
MSTPLRSKKGGSTVMYVIVGLLILGLGGFGVTSFGGGSTTAVATVGDTEISVNDYARELQGEMRAASAELGQPVTMAMAEVLGLAGRVQSRLLTRAALDGEARRIGLSVGDGEIADRITGDPGLAGLDGAFSREKYAEWLRQQGLTESGYEAQVRADVARTLLVGSVTSAVEAPTAFVDTLAAYLGETRDFTLAELLPSDLPEPVGEPTEADLKAYYDAHPDDFTKPETRRITYVWLKPEDVAATIEVDEAALQAAYEARKSEYVVPERRLVERLTFEDQEAADAAKARLDAGEITFEDLAGERGLTLEDIDLGEATREDLGPAADTVFAMTEPGIAGPVSTDLGPALYAMNGILAASETPLAEVRDDLAAEARADRARRKITEESAGIEDILASGATLEDVAAETGMTLGTIEYNSQSEGGLAGYEAFRSAAGAVTAEDFPELVELDDGGVFALRLDGIDPPTLRPFDEVRDKVADDWRRDETHARLKTLGETVIARIAGGQSLEAQGLVVTRFEGFARGGVVADTPGEVVKAAFATEAGTATVVDASLRVHIVSVTAVAPEDPATEDAKRVREAISAEARQAVQNDVFDLFTQSLQLGAGITLNQAAMNAVHTQIR